jgi:hypothetical protein
MSTRTIIAIAAACSLLAALPAGVAQAKPEGLPSAAVAAATGQSHADVMRYWTPERIAGATPADVTLDADGRRVATKGKPSGGGGGGSTTTVTGASWTTGGAVLNTTGKVLFTMAGTNYVCSASVVQDGVAGRALAMTAGHCVYDDVKDAFATNWLFIPAFDVSPTFTCANTPFGCWSATALVTTTQWAASDFDHDLGFAVLGQGGKSNTQVDDVVGAQAVAFNTIHPTQVYAFGYPAASPYTGNDLVYCAGKDAPDTWGGSSTYSISCTLNGGSSGGPWFRDFNPSTGIGTLTSVNSFTYRGVKNRMFGPYLGPVEQAAYTTAISVTTSSLS